MQRTALSNIVRSYLSQHHSVPHNLAFMTRAAVAPSSHVQGKNISVSRIISIRWVRFESKHRLTVVIKVIKINQTNHKSHNLIIAQRKWIIARGILKLAKISVAKKREKEVKWKVKIKVFPRQNRNLTSSAEYIKQQEQQLRISQQQDRDQKIVSWRFFPHSCNQSEVEIRRKK